MKNERDPRRARPPHRCRAVGPRLGAEPARREFTSLYDLVAALPHGDRGEEAASNSEESCTGRNREGRDPLGG